MRTGGLGAAAPPGPALGASQNVQARASEALALNGAERHEAPVGDEHAHAAKNAPVGERHLGGMHVAAHQLLLGRGSHLGDVHVREAAPVDPVTGSRAHLNRAIEHSNGNWWLEVRAEHADAAVPSARLKPVSVTTSGSEAVYQIKILDETEGLTVVAHNDGQQDVRGGGELCATVRVGCLGGSRRSRGP
jgi:hypothetical protein